MSANSLAFFIGWDVGGWNCDKNGKSRDAIVILNIALRIVGQPWRGNLRKSINDSVSGREWIEALFNLCGAQMMKAASVTMAIDTPLGFSDAFLALACNLQPSPISGASRDNPYLFRYTEQHLFRRGLNPLSAIKDMIGSQATKGMHVLGKFASQVERCGVWTDGNGLHIIETYPTACRESSVLRALLKGCKSLGHEDKDAAHTCAAIAYLFANQPDALDAPLADVPQREGWIWVPKK
jgi:hypothetical protein